VGAPKVGHPLPVGVIQVEAVGELRRGWLFGEVPVRGTLSVGQKLARHGGILLGWGSCQLGPILCGVMRLSRGGGRHVGFEAGVRLSGLRPKTTGTPTSTS